jgi:hypothetical protein
MGFVFLDRYNVAACTQVCNKRSPNPRLRPMPVLQHLARSLQRHTYNLQLQHGKRPLSPTYTRISVLLPNRRIHTVYNSVYVYTI